MNVVVVVEEQGLRARAGEAARHDGVALRWVGLGFQPGPLQAPPDEDGHLLDAGVNGGDARLAAQFLEIGNDLIGMIVDMPEDGVQIARCVHGETLLCAALALHGVRARGEFVINQAMEI
ncbi:MAG: hypothetical protein VCF07_13575 [Nitrospinota bacterium]